MKLLTSLSLILFLASSQCLPQSQESGDGLPQIQVQELVQTGGNNNSTFVTGENFGSDFLEAVSSIQVQDRPPIGEIGAPLLATAAFFYFYIDELREAVSTIQDPSSPLHFLLQYIPPSITDLLPQQVRTGPVGATLGLVLLAVGVFYTSTILYYIIITLLPYHPIYLIGKYIYANFAFPDSVETMAEEAAKTGRSLLSDPVALDNLSQGVLKAVDKYNQLQEIYGEY